MEFGLEVAVRAEASAMQVDQVAEATSLIRERWLQLPKLQMLAIQALNEVSMGNSIIVSSWSSSIAVSVWNPPLSLFDNVRYSLFVEKKFLLTLHDYYPLLLSFLLSACSVFTVLCFALPYQIPSALYTFRWWAALRYVWIVASLTHFAIWGHLYSTSHSCHDVHCPVCSVLRFPLIAYTLCPYGSRLLLDIWVIGVVHYQRVDASRELCNVKEYSIAVSVLLRQNWVLS